MSEVISSEQHFLISLYKNTVRTRLASILNIINGLFRQRDCSFYIIKMEIMITSLVYCHCVYPHLFHFFFYKIQNTPTSSPKIVDIKYSKQSNYMPFRSSLDRGQENRKEVSVVMETPSKQMANCD